MMMISFCKVAIPSQWIKFCVIIIIHLINDEEWYHENDIINSEYYSLIKGIKNEILKKC